MNALAVAVSTEFLKARRSKVPWSIGTGFSLAPLVGGLFMVILKDPDRARQLGLLGAKAQLTAGVADWPTYTGLLAQAVAVGGGVLFALLTAWVFGREFADRTIRVLLAIPTPRRTIVIAKSLVVAIWCGVIAVWVIALGFGIGLIIGLPGWSVEMALHRSATIALTAVLVTLLQTTTAFVAGVGRGYIPPLAWAFLTIFVAQVMAVLGLGAWFPWAVPALVSGATGREGEVATVARFVLVAVTALRAGRNSCLVGARRSDWLALLALRKF